MKHMVKTLVFPGTLQGYHILGIGDHADQPFVPHGVGADGADLTIGEVLAHLAGVYRLFGIQNGFGEFLRLVLWQIQHKKGQPLGRFIADARQTLKLLNELFHRRREIFHD